MTIVCGDCHHTFGPFLRLLQCESTCPLLIALFDLVAQNIPLELAEVSGMFCRTSQCSTIFPSTKRKKSATASPGSPGVSVICECVTAIAPSDTACFVSRCKSGNCLRKE